jgi:hypothetical protein
MPSLPALPEVAQFLGRVLRATRKGTLQWESSREPNTLIADLENGYSVLLREVPDFDSSSADPDHIVEVYNEGNHIFSVDRRTIDVDSLSAELGEQVEVPYSFFVELWNRAELSSARVEQHLKAVNALLDSKLR